MCIYITELAQKKILFLGDMAYAGYRLAKLTREYSYNVDYLAYYNKEVAQGNYSWTYFYKTKQTDNFNKLKIIGESISFCKKYELVHAHSIFAVPMLFSNKPFVLHLHGSDVRKYAKEHNLLGLSLRQLIRKANNIIVSTPDLLKEVSYFGKSATFLPNPIDFNMYKPYTSPINLHDDAEFVIFHPSSHSSLKRNDILIKAFYNLIEEGYSAKLVMVDWGNTTESKKLIEKLKLIKYIQWLDQIPFTKMADYYNASDLVCDQFLLGLGQVSLEAMACGKPVISKYNINDIMDGYSSVPPIPNIENEDNILREFKSLLYDKKVLINNGNKCLDWVKKEHSNNKIIGLLSECYTGIK